MAQLPDKATVLIIGGESAAPLRGAPGAWPPATAPGFCERALCPEAPCGPGRQAPSVPSSVSWGLQRGEAAHEASPRGSGSRRCGESGLWGGCTVTTNHPHCRLVRLRPQPPGSPVTPWSPLTLPVLPGPRGLGPPAYSLGRNQTPGRRT